MAYKRPNKVTKRGQETYEKESITGRYHRQGNRKPVLCRHDSEDASRSQAGMLRCQLSNHSFRHCQGDIGPVCCQRHNNGGHCTEEGIRRNTDRISLIWFPIFDKICTLRLGYDSVSAVTVRIAKYKILLEMKTAEKRCNKEDW